MSTSRTGATTCEWSRLPLWPIVATVQLDEWAYQSDIPVHWRSSVSLDPMIEKVGTNDSKAINRDITVLSTIDFKPRDGSETEK